MLIDVGSVNAADLAIAGKKLLRKSNPKMTLLSKDTLVVPGANASSADPRCVAEGGSGAGGLVRLCDGAARAIADALRRTTHGA